MNLFKRALLSGVPTAAWAVAACRAHTLTPLLLMWLQAPELTAVQMVPSGSH